MTGQGRRLYETTHTSRAQQKNGSYAASARAQTRTGGSAGLAPVGMYRRYAVALSRAHRPLTERHHETGQHLGDVPMLQHDGRQRVQLHQSCRIKIATSEPIRCAIQAISVVENRIIFTHVCLGWCIDISATCSLIVCSLDSLPDGLLARSVSQARLPYL